MFKSIALVLVVCCTVLVAASIQEEESVKSGMSDAYRRGIERFGSGQESEVQNQQAPAQNSGSPKIFSHYTSKLEALGGGKPKLREQYRRHSYVPYAPSVIPREHPVTPNGKLTPGAAAKIYVPHRPYQFSNDHMW